MYAKYNDKNKIRTWRVDDDSAPVDSVANTDYLLWRGVSRAAERGVWDAVS